jgi:hypothetical protein
MFVIKAYENMADKRRFKERPNDFLLIIPGTE